MAKYQLTPTFMRQLARKMERTTRAAEQHDSKVLLGRGSTVQFCWRNLFKIIILIFIVVYFFTHSRIIKILAVDSETNLPHQESMSTFSVVSRHEHEHAHEPPPPPSPTMTLGHTDAYPLAKKKCKVLTISYRMELLKYIY
mmetsp:Transcript_7431/g.11179  ORF Transcript_7431/g.11179 Transcript_7431/m.11179 type:complete len:141 (-) Transcript_7431:883-1305(-)